MANVLDTLEMDWDRLQDFTDDLEGTLCMIAYAGYDNDRKFILSRQRSLRLKYRKEIDKVHAPPIFAFECIDRAWMDFEELTSGGDTAEQAEEILQHYLLFELPVQFTCDKGEEPFQG
jgi:hypothetical protein